MISAVPDWRSWRRLFLLAFLAKDRLLLVDGRMNACARVPVGLAASDSGKG
jgi:hypothetical protein